MEKISRKKSGIFLSRRFYLLLLFFFIVLLCSFYFVRFLFSPNTGLIDNYPEIIYSNGNLIFSPRAFFSPAVKAGLLPGKDAIVAINGEPVGRTRDLVRLAYEIKAYKPFSISIIRDASQKLEIEIIPEFTVVHLDWIFILLLSSALAYTAFFLFKHYPHHRAFSFIGFACLIYLLVICVKPFFYETVFSIVLIQIGSFAPWLLVFYGLHYPTAKGNAFFRKTLFWLILGIFIIYSLIRIYYIQQWFAFGDEYWLLQFRKIGRVNNVTNGVAYLLFIFLLLYSYYTTDNVRVRNQFHWLIVGFTISIFAYYCMEELPLIIGEQPGFRFSPGNLSVLFLVPMPLFFLVGLLSEKKIRYRTVRNGLLVHIVLLISIFCFFFVLFQPLKNYFIKNNGLSLDLAGFLTFILLFIFLFPLYFLATNMLKKIFYMKKYRLSAEYTEDLEAEITDLRFQRDQLKLNNSMNLQEHKSRDYGYLVKGVTNFTSKSIIQIKKAITELESMKLNEREEHEILNQALNSLKEEYLVLSDFTTQLKTSFVFGQNLKSKISLAHLLSRAREEVLRKYGEIAIRIALEKDVKLECNSKEIIAALQSIFENSFEAFSDSRLLISTKVEVKQGKCIIRIEDNGSGISFLNENRIFKPFYTTKKGHLGIGLYLAKLYIEKNKGQIECRNLPDMGCVFTTIFPLEQSEE